MLIGELSERTGVSVRSLRYYEEQGLLSARRDGNTYRRYDEQAVSRVAHIQLLFAAGLCSSKIAALLPCIHGTEVEIAPESGLAAELEVAQDRIRGQMDELQSSLDLLGRLLAASRNGTAVAMEAASVTRP
jgi:DNA-binding transcriptional MerR regulator